MTTPLAPRATIFVWLAAFLASGCHHTPPAESHPAQSSVPAAQGAAVAERLPQARERTLRIELEKQRFSYFEDGRLVRSGEISAGTPEHPTPTGDFRVLSKEKNKVSRSYTNYFDMPTPMPYSLQFHGPYFVHEGWIPGRPDSHGCVRLHYEDARFLFERMKRGDAVKITDSGSAGRPQAQSTSGTPARGAGGGWLDLGERRRDRSPTRDGG